MKKQLAALTTSAVMLLTVIPLPGYAAAGLVLSAESVTADCTPGETVRMPVRADENAGYAAGIIDVAWNSDALTLTGVTYDAELAPENDPAPIDGTSGTCRLAFGSFTSTESFTGTGEFFVLEFTINEGAKAGSYPVTLTDQGVCAADASFLQTELTGGTVTLTEEPDMLLTAGTVTAAAGSGEEIRVPVTAETNPGYAVGAMNVSWNADALILNAVEYNAGLAPANQPAPVKNSGSYRVSFGDFLATENFTGTGVLFTLVFTAAEDAAADTYPITFNKPDFLNTELEALIISCTDGAVVLSEEALTTTVPETTAIADETTASAETTTAATETTTYTESTTTANETTAVATTTTTAAATTTTISTTATTTAIVTTTAITTIVTTTTTSITAATTTTTSTTTVATTTTSTTTVATTTTSTTTVATTTTSTTTIATTTTAKTTTAAATDAAFTTAATTPAAAAFTTIITSTVKTTAETTAAVTTVPTTASSTVTSFSGSTASGSKPFTGTTGSSVVTGTTAQDTGTGSSGQGTGTGTTGPETSTGTTPTTPTTENTAQIMLRAEKTTVSEAAGQEVRVPVCAEQNPGYAVGAVTVSWDADALILKSVEYNAVLAPANQPAPIKNKGSYRVSFGDFLASENFTGTGELFTLVFETAEGAKQDTYPITFSKPDFVDKDMNIVAAACENGAVTLNSSTTTSTAAGAAEPVTTTNAATTPAPAATTTASATASAPVTTTAAVTTSASVTTTAAATTSASVTTTAAATTSAPLTTTAAVTTSVSVTTTAAVTTSASVTTTAAVTTSVPLTTTAAVTTSVPLTTTAALTTSVPLTTTAAVTTSAPLTTTAAVTTSAPLTTTAAVTTSAPLTTTAMVTTSTLLTTTAAVTTSAPAATTAAATTSAQAATTADTTSAGNTTSAVTGTTEAAQIVLHAETVSCKPEAGKEVRVPVTADSSTGYAVGLLNVSWNADALILKSVEYNAELAPANQPAAIKNSGSYRVCFGDYLATENFTGTGVLFTLVFETADGAAPDTYPITFGKPDFLDKDMNTVTVTCTDGAVTLESGGGPDFLRGDTDCNGEVSIEDVQLALKAYTMRVSGKQMDLTDKQIKAADVNEDGELSVDDVQNILIYYVNNTVAGKSLTWEQLLGKQLQS